MIYLIRHTTPAVEKGICYGQSDLDVTETFFKEADAIREHLVGFDGAVFTSPLQRCHKLAQNLFPQHELQMHDHLKEIHCGEWEMRAWDAIPREELDPWMNDFVNVTIPGGESYTTLYKRVARCFDRIANEHPRSAIVAHGGVLRSILAHVTATPLADSFSAFSIHYGCVVRLTPGTDGWRHEFLWNQAGEKEQHQPSYY
jgi:alpha-ribazole phosphatase